MVAPRPQGRRPLTANDDHCNGVGLTSSPTILIPAIAVHIAPNDLTSAQFDTTPSIIGTIVGAIPGAGADIAAYVSYAVSKRTSKNRDKFGTGIPDGIASASSSNNAAIGGALVPATVFGIPGDSLTAVIIGVLFLKGLNPGPTIFLIHPELIMAVFLSFLIANILIIPFGFAAIYTFQYVLKIPRAILMPAILAFCMVGAFAVENSMFAVGTMLAMGLFAYVFEQNGFPLAPTILALVIGPMLESTFLQSLERARGNLVDFVNRPMASVLAVITILLWVVPIIIAILKHRSRKREARV